MNAQPIEGAVALVTGAHGGIGRALTEALLIRGVRKVFFPDPLAVDFGRQFGSSPKTAERP